MCALASRPDSNQLPSSSRNWPFCHYATGPPCLIEVLHASASETAKQRASYKLSWQTLAEIVACDLANSRNAKYNAALIQREICVRKLTQCGQYKLLDKAACNRFVA